MTDRPRLRYCAVPADANGRELPGTAGTLWGEYVDDASARRWLTRRAAQYPGRPTTHRNVYRWHVYRAHVGAPWQRVGDVYRLAGTYDPYCDGCDAPSTDPDRPTTCATCGGRIIGGTP